MLKKTLISTVILLIACHSANATRARMQGLGQSQQVGSFYLDDTRNVFRNAAYAAVQKDYVLAEWNNTAVNSTTSDGEGGYFMGAGAMNYGVYFGADIDQRTQNTARATNTYTQSDDLIDLFLSGGDSTKWGVRVNYGKNKLTSGTNTAYGLGFGAIMEEMEFFANLDMFNESELSTGNKFEGDFGYNVGLTYDFMDMTVWAVYSGFGYEIKPTSGAATTRETMKAEVGLGREYEVSNTSRVITDISYFYQEQDDKVTTTVTTKTRGLDINIGFEADATSWLTWRGSFKQDLTSEIFGSVETANTNINGGATLTFGKLMVDGTIGFTSGKVGSNDLLGQVGVHYWF